jgi:hypothetical protein
MLLTCILLEHRHHVSDITVDQAGALFNKLFPSLWGTVAPAGRRGCEGAWTSWGRCNVSCGTGTMSRTYTITKRAIGGGQAYPAADGAVDETTCQGTDPSFDPTNCTLCSPGYGGPACTICPVGEWSAGGDPVVTTCTACDTGSTTAGQGTNSSSGCGESTLSSAPHAADVRHGMSHATAAGVGYVWTSPP